MYPAAVATGTAILCAGLAIALFRDGRRLRVLIPASGGLLLGVAAFGLVPEVAGSIGWGHALLLVLGGYGLLTVLDRFAYSVCPACSHDHDHHGCRKTLHGYAAPLVCAAAVHALIDGWGLITVHLANPAFATSITLAILLHKIPEGVALGTMLKAATGSARLAFALCCAAEIPTLAGGAAGMLVNAGFWLNYPLAIAAGTFLFLGFHAVHGDWKNRGGVRTAIPTLAGGASAALIQMGVRTWVK